MNLFEQVWNPSSSLGRRSCRSITTLANACTPSGKVRLRIECSKPDHVGFNTKDNDGSAKRNPNSDLVFLPVADVPGCGRPEIKLDLPTGGAGIRAPSYTTTAFGLGPSFREFLGLIRVSCYGQCQEC